MKVPRNDHSTICKKFRNHSSGNLQNLREKLLRKVEEYKQKRCNKNGIIKKGNISRVEFEGLKEIREDKEMVVFSTDKSKRLTADSVPNYEKALNEHTKDDTKISEKEVRKIEAKMNNHLKYFNKMFQVGATWGHEDRVAGASTSTNVPPPAKYCQRKDHKPVAVGQEHIGPQVRPICGANEAPNSRFSHFLSKMVCNYADSIEDHHECKSSEEMRASLEKFNNLEQSVREKCVILSMDVKALYPSMQWDDIVIAVKEMIMKSKMEVDNVDWVAVGKYVAVMVPEAIIEQEGLANAVLTRKRIEQDTSQSII